MTPVCPFWPREDALAQREGHFLSQGSFLSLCAVYRGRCHPHSLSHLSPHHMDWRDESSCQPQVQAGH